MIAKLIYRTWAVDSQLICRCLRTSAAADMKLNRPQTGQLCANNILIGDVSLYFSSA